MTILYLLIVSTFLLFGAGLLAFCDGQGDLADYLAKMASTFGILSAIASALFIDKWKEGVHKIILKITTPAKPNTVTDYFEGPDGIPCAKYVHHLVVVNETQHRTVQNCRVWLKSVAHWENGEWYEKQTIAVPRLMDWAPNEWRPEERTFCTSQIFDLGVTVGGNGGFVLSMNKSIGGNFARHFPVNSVLKLTLFLTADNYQGYREFT